MIGVQKGPCVTKGSNPKGAPGRMILAQGLTRRDSREFGLLQKLRNDYC
jgi:hypothetical protein